MRNCCSCCSCRIYTRLYTYISVYSSLKVFRDSHSNLFISSFCQELLPDLPRSQLRATSNDVLQVSLKTANLLRNQKKIQGKGIGCRLVADAELVLEETPRKTVAKRAKMK